MSRADHRVAGRRSGGRLHKVCTALVGLVLTAAVGAELGVLPSPSEGKAHPPQLVEPPLAAGVKLPRVPSVGPVLPEMRAAGGISPSALERLLADAVDSRALGYHFAMAVEELGDARPVTLLGGSEVVTPASLVKLLTTVAALAALGPDHRFQTTVVTGASKHDVVLVGGGDPLLTGRAAPSRSVSIGPHEASLADLAKATARRLAKDGVRRVRLSYDASLFSGPAVNPAWGSTYIRDSVVSPISALWIDEGRSSSGLVPPAPDPAQAAALRFATLLRSAGLVVASDVSAGGAAPSALRLAVVESPPLAQIVEHVIAASDNEGAEVLLRQVALATGRPGSAAAGVRAVRRTLAGLGIDLSGASLDDGSGLARSDALPVQALLDVLQLAADPAHPDLRTVVSSLPVAGFTGSLTHRFVLDAPGGLGVVRAKTGTLTGVHGLAGLVVTRDGQTLVFAAAADQVPVRRTLAARAQLDRIASLLTTCGCTR